MNRSGFVFQNESSKCGTVRFPVLNLDRMKQADSGCIIP